MTVYERIERVEAMQWQLDEAPDPFATLEEVAEHIVAWVNANGGQAEYRPADQCPPSYEPRIAVRTINRWVEAAPGDFVEMGDATFATFEATPFPGSVKRLRDFIVRNGAYYNDWTVVS